MRPHMPALGIQVVGEKWRVGGAWVGFWLRCFEKSCRSPLCAPDDVVDVGKYRRKNINGDEGFLTTIWLTEKL